MADLQRTREVLERVSRAVEANPGASAPMIRKRAGVRRVPGDEALDLLRRAGFIERNRAEAMETYHSVRAYRASNEAPRAAFAETHAVREGGA